MNTDSLNFDRVAHIYDETRTMPEAAAEDIVDCIVRATGAIPTTCFLEIGVGTGRIAVPIARRGYPYTGVDISERMTEVLRHKAESSGVHIDLAYSDITRLPFPDDSFDVVIAVHILHLVPEWKQALGEVRRVLRPAGHFVLGQEHGPAQNGQIQGRWREFVVEAGGEFRPTYGTWDRVGERLTELGAYSAEYRATRWEGTLVPLELFEQLRNQVFSGSWGLSENVLTAADARIREWVAETIGDPATPQRFSNEFLVLASTFP